VILNETEIRRALQQDAADEDERMCPQCGSPVNAKGYSAPWCSETCRILFRMYLERWFPETKP